MNDYGVYYENYLKAHPLPTPTHYSVFFYRFILQFLKPNLDWHPRARSPGDIVDAQCPLTAKTRDLVRTIGTVPVAVARLRDVDATSTLAPELSAHRVRARPIC